MFRFVLQLRFFFVLLLGGLLLACSKPVEKGDEKTAIRPCPSGKNLVVCFFEEAEHDGDNYGVPLESTPIHKLRFAFRDAITLPLEELRVKRYANDRGESDKLAFHELLSAYFVSDSSVSPGDEGFYDAIKEPEALEMLEGWLSYFDSNYEKMVAFIEEGGVACGPSDNIAVCFFASAYPQGDHSPEPVRDALRDALTLSLEELRTRRYADYSMKPDQWTFEEVIGSTFTGGAKNRKGHIIGPRTKGFLEAVKQPEARPVLEKLLANCEENVLEYKDLEEFRRKNASGD